MSQIPSYFPENQYQLKTKGNDDKYCLLKFSKCDRKYPLQKLSSEDLKAFVKFAQKVENMSWESIKVHTGLNFEQLNNMGVPKNIPKDASICSMRLSKKSRIIGYREEEFFNIIWFDNNHKTC